MAQVLSFRKQLKVYMSLHTKQVRSYSSAITLSSWILQTFCIGNNLYVKRFCTYVEPKTTYTATVWICGRGSNKFQDD